MWQRIREALEEDWQPVSKPALIAWLLFYVLFLWHAYGAEEGTIADLVSLPIHEGGHLVFAPLGEWAAVLGGTFLQLAVPLGLAASFALRRHAGGTAFCLFFFFENFLNVGAYMADARIQLLDLVTVGESETVIHDWEFIFTGLGLMPYDTAIGQATRVAGWLGMIGTVGWLVYRARAAE